MGTTTLRCTLPTGTVPECELRIFDTGISIQLKVGETEFHMAVQEAWKHSGDVVGMNLLADELMSKLPMQTTRVDCSTRRDAA